MPGGGRARGAFSRIPAIRVAFALSLLLHAALLWLLAPHLLERFSDRAGSAKKGGGPLAVRLAAPPTATMSATPSLPAPPAPAPPRPAAKRAPPPTARPTPAPRVVAKDPPVPAVAAAPAAPPAAAPAPAPAESDFSTYIEARRRARGATPETSTPAAEDERARQDRIVAENLGLNHAPTFGREPTGGGIFQLERVGYGDAEFVFFGWNRDIRRRSRQVVRVEKGADSDIRIAVVRRMIGIIREHESGDFVWLSHRLGREITLSARAADNAGLEDFLMQEFFPAQRPG